jgi:hypothetical protein
LSVFLADIISGTIYQAYAYEKDGTIPKYIDILKSKLSIIDFPRKYDNYFTNSEQKSSDIFNPQIADLSFLRATDFINRYSRSDDQEVKNQVQFLNYLLFEIKHISLANYVSTPQIIEALGFQTGKRLSRQYIYRKIIAPLRDKGVIIASCSHGYKIPVCEKEIYDYLKQSSIVITPMLSRMGECRDSILNKTNGKLDILDTPEYTKLKKYFD